MPVPYVLQLIFSFGKFLKDFPSNFHLKVQYLFCFLNRLKFLWLDVISFKYKFRLFKLVFIFPARFGT